MAALVSLVERLAAADQAMQSAQKASDLMATQREARTVLDLVTGPGGRHAGPKALSPGILPADGPSITDPGLALAVYDGSKDPRVRQLIQSVVLGEASRWRHPAQRWDEIDAAVAGWTPQHNPMPNLDGHIMRAVGWSLLILRTTELERAHEFAGHGILHTELSLQAAREALEWASLPTPSSER